MNHSRAFYRHLLSAVAGFALLAGCGREDGITSYSVPKDSDPALAKTGNGGSSDEKADGTEKPGKNPLPPGHPPVAGTPEAAPATPPASAVAGAGEPTWTLPANWKPIPLGMMDFARFATSGEPDALPVTVTGARGSMLSNVNRWEGQLGLAPTPEAELGKVVKETSINGVEAYSVDLKSNDGRRMVVTVIPQGDEAWFFKLLGPAEKVAAAKPDFDAFLKSVKFGPAAASAPGPVGPVGPVAPIGPVAPAADSTPFTFTAPPAWKALPLPAAGPMGIRRAAAFSVTGENGGTAEVTVIPLPPGSGDLAANLDRWRGQVGLPPGGEGYEPKKVNVDGMEALLIDLTGPASDTAPAKRLIMAVRTDAHTSWFFKILGPADVVSSQQAAFAEFLKSVKFKTAPH